MDSLVIWALNTIWRKILAFHNYPVLGVPYKRNSPSSRLSFKSGNKYLESKYFTVSFCLLMVLAHAMFFLQIFAYFIRKIGWNWIQ